MGVECLRCGRVRVFCDWEAERSFRERRWSTDLDSAARRLRCPCGSGEVRLVPVPIWKRPKPLPVRPAALRPIYSDDARALARRGRVSPPDAAAIDEAVETLRSAVERFPARSDRESLISAAQILRPHIYHADFLDALVAGLTNPEVSLTYQQQVIHPFTIVLRQLGRRVGGCRKGCL